MYYIKSEGKNSFELLLADRAKTKKQWWTYDIIKAKSFRTYQDADKVCSRLKYNNPTIITGKEASIIGHRNFDLCYSEHPFSSEGLGQY